MAARILTEELLSEAKSLVRESSLTCSSSGIVSFSPVCEFQYKCLNLLPFPGFIAPHFLL